MLKQIIIMSRVTYFNGSKEYSFDSRLQIDNMSLIAVEENLHEEVRMDFQKRKIPYYGVHDISLFDDNGKIANTVSFSEIGNLKIIKQ